MCFCPMKIFGTEVWLVISARADWMADPSSKKRETQCQPLQSIYNEKENVGGFHTNLVQLQGVELSAHFAQQGLGGFAVGTP